MKLRLTIDFESAHADGSCVGNFIDELFEIQKTHDEQSVCNACAHSTVEPLPDFARVFQVYENQNKETQ